MTQFISQSNRGWSAFNYSAVTADAWIITHVFWLYVLFFWRRNKLIIIIIIIIIIM